eukprot:1129299-Prymnesium_polylepis.1
MVFNNEAFSLLCLVANVSLRECDLFNQSFKWSRNEDGSKERQMLAPGSKQRAPEMFNLLGIKEADRRSLARTGVSIHKHSDWKGADIAGKPYSLD